MTPVERDPKRRIFRYEVPVDDQWHTLHLSGEVLHIASRDHHLVEVWAMETEGTRVARDFFVVGTGHAFPAEACVYQGTALTDVGLVWHLLERW